VIRAEELKKSFHGAGIGHVLKDVSFRVEPGTVYTLLGPSGCGKTTLLRSVAGLEAPDSGRIHIGDREVFSSTAGVNVRPNLRRIGMVFQSYAIWPHMTVGQNVAYPLEGTRVSRTEIAQRVKAALDLVGLQGLQDRPAPNLSGGQQQRVAFARALVNNPDVVLLDEPLSNLDAKLREQMRDEIIRLQTTLGLTVLYVTHDQEEALSLSQRVALMRSGEIIEEGDPVSLYERPVHPFTATFLGSSNWLPCTVPSNVHVDDRVPVDTVFGRFWGTVRKGEPGQSNLFFRPHHAAIGTDSAKSAGLGEGDLSHATYLGEKTALILHRDNQAIRMNVPRFDSGVAPGQRIAFNVDPDRSLIFFGQALPARSLAARAPLISVVK
jgi:iron(III) transport system ATP-binding protein